MVEQFSKYIDILADDVLLREKLGVAAILHVKRHFLWEDKITEMIDIYQSLV